MTPINVFDPFEMGIGLGVTHPVSRNLVRPMANRLRAERLIYGKL